MKKTLSSLIIITLYLWGNAVIGKPIVIPKGELVYGLGQALYKMDLSTCHAKKLYSNDTVSFTKVAKVDNDRFLFLYEGLFSPTEKNTIGIKMFNLQNNSITTIYEGGYAFYYNPFHQKIFFSVSHSLKEGAHIYMGDLNNTSISSLKKIAKGSPDVNDMGVIPISRDAVIFNNRDNPTQVLLYNIVTNHLKKLPITNCNITPIWRSATQQLLCYNPKKENYFLTDLSGKKTRIIIRTSNFTPILYLPEQDEMLFIKTIFTFHDPEEGELGIYDFATGRSKILCKNIDLGTGDAIFYPE